MCHNNINGQYICKKCGKCFHQKKSLTKHWDNFHCKIPKIYMCHNCDACFTHKIELQRHIQNTH